MSCKVKKILTPNGNPSKVFNQISSVYGAEVGLVAYLHMHSETFLAKNKGKAVDSNGEYDWRMVLDSMNSTENAVNNIVEKSKGVRKATGRLTTFKYELGQETLQSLNANFKKDGAPFRAIAQVEDDGTTTITIEITNSVSLMPSDDSEGGTIEEFDDDTLSLMDFQEDGDYEDYGFSDDLEEDVDEIDYNLGDDFEHNVDMEYIDDDFQQSFSLDDALNDAIDDLVQKKKEKPTKAMHKYKALLKSIDLKKKNLQQRLGRVEDNIRREIKAGNDDKVSNLQARASKYRVELLNINKVLENSDKIKSLEEVNEIAVKDIAFISKKLKNVKDMDILELQGLKRQLDFWSEIGQFRSDEKHMLFTKSDLSSEPMKKLFRKHKTNADNQLIKVNAELNERFDSFLKEKLGANVNLSEAKKLGNDVNFAQAQLLDISRMDNMILQAIFKGVNVAKQKAKNEADKIVQDIDEMMPKVLEEAKKYNKTGNPFDIFLQKSPDGKRTGNAVGMISVTYERERAKNFESIMKDKTSGHSKKSEAQKWLRKNEIFFDWRIIFFDHRKSLPNKKNVPFTKEDRDKHISELEDQLGKEFVDKELANMELKLREYELDYLTKLEEEHRVFDEGDSERIDTHGLKVWEIQNSPFYASKNRATGTSNTYAGKYVPNNGKRYLVSMPRKTISGKSTGYYDSNYAIIQGNAVLKQFHDYYLNTMGQLNLMLPHSKRNKLKNNSIVFVEKTIKEMIWSKELGVDKSSVEILANMAKESVRTSDYGTVASTSIDPSTGEQIREVSANFVDDGKKDLQSIVDAKTLIWLGEHKGQHPNENIKRKWREEAISELAQKKSYDLGHVLKNYALLATAYKHKAAIEDKVHLAYETFKQIQEGVRNAKGDVIKDEYGEEQSKEGLDNLQKSLDHFMDNFDNFKQKDEAVSKVDVYTKSEKAEMKRIDDAILVLDKNYSEGKLNKTQYSDIKSELLLRKERVGGKLSYTKVGEKALWLAQIKGMGWNMPASIVNFIFGQLSNIIEGASGRFFKEGAISSATKEVMFNSASRKKAIMMAKKYNIISDNLDIITGTSKKNFFGRNTNYVSPYGWTSIAEEMNQSPIVLAAMKEEMLEVDGKKISLWDATDANGNLLPEYATTENIEQYQGDNANPADNDKINNFILRTKQIIKKVHGNYDPNSPVLAKRTVYGKALLQFRSWLAESVAARFEGEKVDYITGTTRKGRYRTLWETKTDEGDLISGFGFRISQLAAILKGAIPFLKLQNPSAARLSEVDLQNMKELAKELQITLSLMFIGALAICGREGADDDSFEKWAATFFANNTARVSKDLAAFTSPVWPLEFIKKPVAALTLVDDLRDIEIAFLKLFSGNTTIETGINAGMDRTYKEIIELMPVTNQIFKVDKMGKKLFAEPYSVHGMMGTAISDYLENG